MFGMGTVTEQNLEDNQVLLTQIAIYDQADTTMGDVDDSKSIALLTFPVHMR